MYHCAILKKTKRQFLLSDRTMYVERYAEKKHLSRNVLIGDWAEFEEKGDRMKFFSVKMNDIEQSK